MVNMVQWNVNISATSAEAARQHGGLATFTSIGMYEDEHLTADQLQGAVPVSRGSNTSVMGLRLRDGRTVFVLASSIDITEDGTTLSDRQRSQLLQALPLAPDASSPGPQADSQIPQTPPGPATATDPNLHDRLGTFIDAFDFVVSNQHTRQNDRNATALRGMENGLPWQRMPNGSWQLTLEQDMQYTVHGRNITIRAGTYTKDDTNDTLLTTIAAQMQIEAQNQSLQAILATGVTNPGSKQAAWAGNGLLTTAEVTAGYANLETMWQKSDKSDTALEANTKDLNKLSLVSCAWTSEGLSQAHTYMAELQSKGVIGGHHVGPNGTPPSGPGSTPGQKDNGPVVQV